MKTEIWLPTAECRRKQGYDEIGRYSKWNDQRRLQREIYCRVPAVNYQIQGVEEYAQ